MSVKVIINGALGRMGQALLENSKDFNNLEVIGAVDVKDDITLFTESMDVLIDFTHASVSSQLVKTMLAAGKPLVMGTTGQEAAVRQEITEAAKSIPIVFAPNFSIGVNTLFWLTRKACEALGEDFDLEVVEMHHRLKKDAPSGTARRLAEILTEVRNLDYEKDCRHGREGMVGERSKNEIGVHSLRGGDVIGDHTVIYSTNGERVELTHKASSRSTFARGALRAALWAVDQPPGLYDMQDVLGLKD
ncbi:MAG: 4-hydroxy-tetrahydrodipicolinate reductase [Chthoniobacterales bacterium]